MADETDELWDKVDSAGLFAREQHTQLQQEAFEERVVRTLLTHVGETAWGAMQQASMELMGTKVLTLRFFHEQFPQFPIRLLTNKMKYVHEISLVDLFKRFTRTKVFEQLQVFAEQDGLDLRGEPVGLVFSWPKIAYLMVIHNYPWLTNPAWWEPSEKGVDGFTRVVRPLGNPPVLFTLETMNSLLATVGRDWGTACQ